MFEAYMVLRCSQQRHRLRNLIYRNNTEYDLSLYIQNYYHNY
jgi:hypothetical protein